MPATPRLSPLAITSRTFTVELAGTGALDRFDIPLAYRLVQDGAGVAEGQMDRPVLTLEDLVPGLDYSLEIEGQPPFAFTTGTETAFLDIRDYGASLENADNASAFASALAVAPEGATLFVPPGRWRTGPLALKSGLFLYLPRGAEIVGLPHRDGWPILSAFDTQGRVQAHWEGVPANCYAPLIGITDAHDIIIAGKGIIDGAGSEGDWWSWPKETREGARRPRTLFANRATHLTLAGITVRNSPSWTLHPYDSADLCFADLTIENPPYSPNTDGLNPESCQNVEIVGVRFSVGDDCIAIKAGKVWPDGTVPPPTKNVRVRHCLMQRGHGGVVIGSEMSGSVTDVTVSHCRMVDTDRGLRIKTRRGRGGEVARIAMTDCLMDGVLDPLAVNAHYFCDPDGRSDAVQNRAPAPVGKGTPSVRDIEFARITALNVHHALAFVLGLAESPVTGLRIEDIAVTYAPDAEPGPSEMALGVPDLRHAGTVLENVQAPHVGHIAYSGEPLPGRAASGA